MSSPNAHENAKKTLFGPRYTKPNELRKTTITSATFYFRKIVLVRCGAGNHAARILKRTTANPVPLRRVLVLVDESNVTSSAKAANRKLDWVQLRDSLVGQRELIEMVVYAGLPPAMPEWQAERDKKNKFLHWLRSHGFLVVTKDGSPAVESHYKANVDVMMAIDAVELSVAMHPDVVILLTGDADFAHLALQLRRRGIRVEAASTAQTLGAGLKTAVNEFIDLGPLLETFERLA